MVGRRKLSRGGKEAREVLDYDHTDPKVTSKYHKVEELDEAGEWQTVHEHKDTFPAKRRPKGNP